MEDESGLDTLKQIKKEIRRDCTSLRNRLQSVFYDSKFIANEVLPMFPNYPLVPNERCGLWYCNPGKYEQTCYFKSTDGHTNQWDFSTRRLNFHILSKMAEAGGIIIVDSTRRGKKMPDALSKTIPIWCAVLNNLMLDYKGKEDSIPSLFCPPGTVSKLEFDGIHSKVPDLVEKLKKLNIISGEELYNMFQGKVLRPFWVYPGSPLLDTSRDIFTGEVLGNVWQSEQNSIPVILCTASYQCQDGEDKHHGFTYVQGAADDHELWANGLNPEIFWKNIEFLGDPDKSEFELEDFVQRIGRTEKLTAQSNKQSDRESSSSFIKVDEITKNLYLGTVAEGIALTENIEKELKSKYSLCIICSQSVTAKADCNCERIKVYPINNNSKKSSRDLRVALIEISGLIKQHITDQLPILICCNTGKDISIGIMLTALCQHYDLQWHLEEQETVNKTIVKKHLARIITKLSGININPSRSTLKNVNAFLL
ncbi:tRNA A64-2'-O-ribosylphosphate transferase Ecym_4623 [Eremothecium cymbalariae DBVPG|uniref:Initiator tRNA phosphoribosyl transferase n=1 Tax=Eremothecium cymbalariae (strain CBS 270.75 / DBVPG 7215 / KCTC 17166 / NRRL Y-17582) TaxID=931890 RepID=G8JSC9_ERECY|nr:hypothetical protein Ecym_4623 [Eremothecium cymbalariae DBVPG\